MRISEGEELPTTTKNEKKIRGKGGGGMQMEEKILTSLYKFLKRGEYENKNTPPHSPFFNFPGPTRANNLRLPAIDFIPPKPERLIFC